MGYLMLKIPFVARLLGLMKKIAQHISVWMMMYDYILQGKKLLSVQTVVFQDSPDEMYQPMPIKDPFENPDWKRKTKEGGTLGTLKKSKLVGIGKTDAMYDFDEVCA